MDFALKIWYPIWAFIVEYDNIIVPFIGVMWLWRIGAKEDKKALAAKPGGPPEIAIPPATVETAINPDWYKVDSAPAAPRPQGTRPGRVGNYVDRRLAGILCVEWSPDTDRGQLLSVRPVNFSKEPIQRVGLKVIGLQFWDEGRFVRDSGPRISVIATKAVVDPKRFQKESFPVVQSIQDGFELSSCVSSSTRVTRRVAGDWKITIQMSGEHDEQVDQDLFFSWYPKRDEPLKVEDHPGDRSRH